MADSAGYGAALAGCFGIGSQRLEVEMRDCAQRIEENVTAVRHRIAEAAGRSGRTAEEVTLVAVTKYVGVEEAAALVEAGCADLGESRPQELWHKAEALADAPVRWHLIGHLQRNKIRRTLPYLVLVHSGDSLRLLREIDRVSASSRRVSPVLLEVNVSGDAAKHGFGPEQLDRLLPEIAQLRHLQVRGLMAMAAWASDAQRARREFAALRQLRDHLRPNCPDTISLDELSMGMSRDYEVAIEEGATIVRVGSVLFEGISS